ncbi:hypothetical protein ACFVXG_05335 [Kitasatospora sp. NPDC058162]|uniref:hypothetical protein n=1 Tax=Kitasatospora sp. NPDC058162 TaxID=3346362 RepID=UPI0036DB1D32
MEHVVDLDRAAARITARIPRWRDAGLMVAPLTWWDQLAPWSQPLETDRTRVEIPASVGLQLSDPRTGAELHVVLFCGGWADVDYLVAGWADRDDDGGVGTFPAQDITSADDFEARLVGWTGEVFGG